MAVVALEVFVQDGANGTGGAVSFEELVKT